MSDIEPANGRFGRSQVLGNSASRPVLPRVGSRADLISLVKTLQIILNTNMNSGLVRALALTLVIAAVTETAFSMYCTQATCPDGPVIVYFEFSNCTGQREFYSLGFNADGCVNLTSTSSRLRAVNDNYYETLYFYGSDACGADAPMEGNRYYFGACGIADSKRVGYLSSLYLKNANQSYTAPQEIRLPAQPLPPYPRQNFECSDPADCMSKGVKYTASYQNDTCSINGASYSVITNSTVNTCYDASGSYALDKCLDAYTTETVFSRNGDCSGYMASSLFRSVCTTGYLTTTHCTATPEPTPASTPAIGTPSSGNMTHFSVLAMFLALIVILF